MKYKLAFIRLQSVTTSKNEE